MSYRVIEDVGGDGSLIYDSVTDMPLPTALFSGGKHTSAQEAAEDFAQWLTEHPEYTGDDPEYYDASALRSARRRWERENGWKFV